jgi:hypothetical protein
MAAYLPVRCRIRDRDAMRPLRTDRADAEVTLPGGLT